MSVPSKDVKMKADFNQTIILLRSCQRQMHAGQSTV